jgi:hypothetical protein
MHQADMDGTLTFEPAPAGTRMRWSWQVRSKRPVRLLAGSGDHLDGPPPGQAIWTSMKRHLETPPPGP